MHNSVRGAETPVMEVSQTKPLLSSLLVAMATASKRLVANGLLHDRRLILSVLPESPKQMV